MEGQVIGGSVLLGPASAHCCTLCPKDCPQRPPPTEELLLWALGYPEVIDYRVNTGKDETQRRLPQVMTSQVMGPSVTSTLWMDKEQLSD